MDVPHSDAKRDAGGKSVNITTLVGNAYIGDSPEYKVGSAINELLINLAKRGRQFDRKKRRPSSETVRKIQHNDIKSNIHVIGQYADYSAKIEEAYIEIDSMIVSGKDVILGNLNDLYYAALDALNIDYILSDEIDMDAVRAGSDYIIDYVSTKLKNMVYETSNVPGFREQIEHGVNVVIAHAFIECVVLENPADDT